MKQKEFALICVFSLWMILVIGCNKNQRETSLYEEYGTINDDALRVHMEFHKRMLSEQDKAPVIFKEEID